MHHSLIKDKHFKLVRVDYQVRVADQIFDVRFDWHSRDWEVEHFQHGRTVYSGKCYDWVSPVEPIRQFCDDRKIDL